MCNRVEPLTNGTHWEPGILSFKERLSSLWRFDCTSIIEKNEPQSLSFIERLSSLQRLKCTSVVENEP